MNKYISKSLYLDYLECPKNAWLKLHKNDALGTYFKISEYDSYLIGQGMEVENLAQQLFSSGVKLETFLDTMEHIQKKTPVLFQPTFISGFFMARSDILKYDADLDKWNLYEIKSTSNVDQNSKEIDHIEDASFQVIVIEELGIKINKIFILRLDKEYVLKEELILKDLVKIEDVTEKIKLRGSSTKDKMGQAQIDLLEKDEQEVICPCIYKGRSAHCETFIYNYSEIPEYSVHDVARIGNSPKKLKVFIDRNITDIKCVSCDTLSDKQANQVKSVQQQEIFINRNAIKQELNKLKYPLYFLDYETFSPAIPRYKGFSPYGHIPFQLSLHVLHDEYSEPIHYGYLHESNSDPSLHIINTLKEHMGSQGSIIVWYQSFEKSRNKELGERHPEAKKFLDDVNMRIYDLMEIFSEQYYVHPEFRGSTSIKNVLPVLFPDLNYKNLDIQEGVQASLRWFNMITGCLNEDEKQKTVNSLIQYCKQDTYAMYVIWRHLMNIVNHLP